ncbi:MAG: TIR domain-containing protein [Anaerolineaceae bacterium]|nr:TIR domain-containing protein [Anaerolineaceae bacterium]
MPEAFISYAREDTPFVRRVADGLTQQGREIWVDWEDIPLTADWLAEAYAGIESADNFIFVISPDSIQSGPCTLELEHALDNNKRLIPILRREVLAEEDKSKMHHSLSAHNWLKALKDEEFENTFNTLVEVMDTDLDYIRAHTRNTIRATEWQDNRQDRSFLLQGSDLRAANAWLEQGASRQPAPTELHYAYIQASQREARRRRTVTLISALIFLVISGLAILAIYNAVLANQNAEAARIAELDAQFNARQAQSLALAARAQQFLFQDNNTDLALALALQANEIPDTTSLTYTQTVLAQAVFTPGTRRLMQGFARYPNADLAFNIANDELLAINSDEDVVRIDFNTQEVQNTWTPPRRIYTTLLSPGGEQALAVDSDGAAYLLTFTDDGGMDVAYEWSTDYLFVSAAFTPTGESILFGSYDGTVTLWNLATFEVTQTFDPGTGSPAWSVAVSGDGLWGLSGDQNGVITMWNLQTGKAVHEFTGHEGRIFAVAFSPDGSQILSGAADNDMRLWDVDTQEAMVFAGHTNSVLTVAFSADGRFGYSGGLDGNLIEWDLNRGDQVRYFVGHRATVYALRLDSSGRLISGSSDGTIRWWDVENGALIHRFIGHEAPVYSVDFSPDGGLVASASDDGTIRMWDLKAGRQVDEFTDLNGSGVTSVAFSPDGLSLVSGSRDGTIRVWSLETRKNTQTLLGHQATVWSVLYSPDGTKLVSGSWDGTIILWDIIAGTQITVFPNPSTTPSRVYGVDLSPDGTRILAAYNDQFARLWDVDTGEMLMELSGHTGTVYDVVFSPDGAQALTGSLDQDILLWNLDTGDIIRRFTGHTDDVYSVAFSTDGTQALSSSLDGSTRLWEISTGNELLRFSARTGVWDATFSPDAQTILTGAEDGTPRLWQVFTLDATLAWIQKNRYVAELTCEQQIQYRISDSCDSTGA